MSEIIRERLSEHFENGKNYYVVEKVLGSSGKIDEINYDILDENFNRLAMQLGVRHNEVSEERLAEFKNEGKNVFLGEASPISIICDKYCVNFDLDRLRAIWEILDEEELKHYKTLLRASNERLLPIDNEGKQYYIHFTSKIHGDENYRGKFIEALTFEYLDENFNKFIINVSKDSAEHYSNVIGEKAKENGREVFIGAHSPEIEDVNGDYVPNIDSNTVGIWEKATPTEIAFYKSMIDRQNEKQRAIRLVH